MWWLYILELVFEWFCVENIFIETEACSTIINSKSPSPLCRRRMQPQSGLLIGRSGVRLMASSPRGNSTMLNTKPPTTFPNFELKITKFTWEKIYENITEEKWILRPHRKVIWKKYLPSNERKNSKKLEKNYGFTWFEMEIIGSGIVLVWLVYCCRHILTVGVHFRYKDAKIVTFLSFWDRKLTVTGYWIGLRQIPMAFWI